MSETTNNPNKAGQRASCMVFFGKHLRYACFAVHTRFDELQWLVADSDEQDWATDRPTIIRQAATFEAAIAGLEA
jgi:hypothetical protein